MSAQVCQNCQRANPADALICANCGHLLPVGERARAAQMPPAVHALQRSVHWGTAYFGEESVLLLRVAHTGQHFEVSLRRECVLGRASADRRPDIDLTGYDAVEMGVSRRHVRISRQFGTALIEDLGSLNGTFLNGERLLPHQSRVLRHDDELQLGRLVLRVSFERAAPAEHKRADQADQGPV